MSRYLVYEGGLFKSRVAADVTQNAHVPGVVSAGDPITLPGGMTYEDSELQVYWNDVPMELTFDFNYEGDGPTRTQVSFTFDTTATDRFRYRINREIT